jgi:RNA polymerase sigma-70 factor (ECF subfamily)
MMAVAQGELQLMAELFERYHKRIYNFLLQMVGDRAVCEDLTQNVFYKAIKYKHSYRGGKFVSWIFRIARNNLADHFEKQKRLNQNIDVEALGERPESVQAPNEEVAHLYQVMERLDVAEKELIIMHRIQGISYEDIAEMTGSTAGAVKVKAHRVVKKLRKIYFEST